MIEIIDDEKTDVSWLKQLLNKNRKKIGLQLEGDCFKYCLFSANSDSAQPTVETIGETTLDPNALESSIKKQIQSLSAENAEAHWVLPSDLYRLISIEKPSVPDAEIPSAIRWQIKDLIDFPIEQACLEYFNYPDNMPGTTRIYVVVVHRSVIEQIVQYSEKAGLKLENISINELALGNLLTNQLHPGQNVALISETGKGIAVNCFMGKDFAFNRALNGVHLPQPEPEIEPENEFTLDLDNENSDSDAVANENATTLVAAPAFDTDQLLLEIQRTLDFYEGQVSRQAVTEIFIPYSGTASDSLQSILQTNLGLNVSVLDIKANWHSSIKPHRLGNLLNVCGTLMDFPVEAADAAN